MRKALIHWLIFSLLLSQFLVQVHAVEHPFHADEQHAVAEHHAQDDAFVSGHDHGPFIDVSLCDELSALEKSSSSFIDVSTLTSLSDWRAEYGTLLPSSFSITAYWLSPVVRAPPFQH